MGKFERDCANRSAPTLSPHVGSRYTSQLNLKTLRALKSLPAADRRRRASRTVRPRISIPHRRVVIGKASSPCARSERVKTVLAHYESQSEEEAVAKDEAAFEALGQTVMEVPTEIVPAIRELIAKHKTG